jgi:hypothetical protein
MKMLTALLVTIALVSPAFAQQTAFQGTHPRPKPVIVAPASKPVLLHTGKPLTADQKKQLMTAMLKASLPKSSSGNTQTRNLTQSAGTTVLTAEQTFMNAAHAFDRSAASAHSTASAWQRITCSWLMPLERTIASHSAQSPCSWQTIQCSSTPSGISLPSNASRAASRKGSTGPGLPSECAASPERG